MTGDGREPVSSPETSGGENTSAETSNSADIGDCGDVGRGETPGSAGRLDDNSSTRPECPTPEAIGFDGDGDTPAQNVERAVDLLREHVDGLTEDVVEEFAARYIRGAGPSIARHALEGTEIGPDTSAALFMGGGSPYAAGDGERHAETSPTTVEPSAESGVSLPTGALPLAHLNALDIHEQATRARQRGEDWPTTEEARERLFDTLAEVMRHEDDRVVDAPTSLGKTYTVAATRWGARDDLTGGRPVVHLLETRDARDEAVEVAKRHGGEHLVLRSRHEACPVAAGEHDEDVTLDGTPAGEWLEAVCEGRGVPFSAAHRHLERHNDQDVDLPCSEDRTCPAIAQWTEYREGDYPLVIATHNFAYAPGLRMHNNVVVDEQPDYRQELSTDRVRRAVGAYLREIDAPASTWEAFIQLATFDPEQYDAVADEVARERDRLGEALDREPARDWYFEHADAHTLAPALARAIFHSRERANGRRAGATMYEPPRLEAEAHDDDAWNRERVAVVLDEANDVRTVRATPDFGAARSVVGLDAHPALPVWQTNTVPWIEKRAVLESEERARWRRHERGLRIVQVGDATRPLASGAYFDYLGTSAIVEQLAAEYGRDFRTAITAKSVEADLQGILAEHVRDPETMHYGEEKSRNDFAGERVGFVNGCIDPGDDYVLDLLAELDLDAEPERSDPDDCEAPENAACRDCDGDGCIECHGTGLRRKVGRGFVGEDAETAAAILASVRENHTAQAAGRYARNPDDPGSSATVFVRTDAMPPGFADVEVPGVVWTPTATQEEIVETLRESTAALSARAIAETAGCSKEHVRTTLGRLVEQDAVQAIDGAGDHGATLYADSGLPHAGVADLGDSVEVAAEKSPTIPYGGTRTWTLAIRDPEAGDDDPAPADPPADTADEGLGRWMGAPHEAG